MLSSNDEILKFYNTHDIHLDMITNALVDGIATFILMYSHGLQVHSITQCNCNYIQMSIIKDYGSIYFTFLQIQNANSFWLLMI